MKKFKVFQPSGTIQTIVAEEFAIQWFDNGIGILRFLIDDKKIAIFPPGGWHGVQDVEVYKKAVV